MKGMIHLHLDTRQINNLRTGITLAAELKSDNPGLRKFLTVYGYSYNADGEVISLNKVLNLDIADHIYFELRCYELSNDFLINNWDVTEDCFLDEVYLDDIKGIEALEIALCNYIQDFSVLKPEWYCDNPL